VSIFRVDAIVIGVRETGRFPVRKPYEMVARMGAPAGAHSTIEIIAQRATGSGPMRIDNRTLIVTTAKRT